MKILRTSDPTFSKEWKEYLDHSFEDSQFIETTVKEILAKVREEGDSALIDFTQQFDHHRLSTLELSPQEVRNAFKKIKKEDLQSLKVAHQRISSFHRMQVCQLSPSKYWKQKKKDILVGERVLPLERVGIYVPGGRAAYPSTVLMNTIPAKMAGVKEIIMTSPWSHGEVNPHTLAAAHMAGVDRIFKIGGAQAIAAMAYGTQTIPAVDKIVGPGNIYVATAKKLVFGKVGIDMIAGPTEIAIIADDSADPAFIVADLASQAEHDPRAQMVLLTPSESLIKQVAQKMESGLSILAKNLQECCELANVLAPEHLEIQTRQPEQLLRHIQNAGAIFLGSSSPVAVGDYLAGPNHVLPTARTARFSSPLGVGDFLKRSSVIQLTPKALKRLGPHVIRLATIEGLPAHAASVKIRFKKGDL